MSRWGGQGGCSQKLVSFMSRGRGCWPGATRCRLAWVAMRALAEICALAYPNSTRAAHDPHAFHYFAASPQFCFNQCNGQGTCIQGYCRCHKGVWGAVSGRVAVLFV